jgi:hypothetical protein
MYPYTCFDPRIIVRGFFLKATITSIAYFEVIVAFFKKKTPGDDPRIETRVGVHFAIKTTRKWFYVCIIWCKTN